MTATCDHPTERSGSALGRARYESPRLIVLGSVTEVTQGPPSGVKDKPISDFGLPLWP